uniref:Uncharacterized protein n=1 Tax=Strongyloides venezuelensis TaxID=75913 RepID=A0A0K0FDB7_STRVS
MKSFTVEGSYLLVLRKPRAQFIHENQSNYSISIIWNNFAFEIYSVAGFIITGSHRIPQLQPRISYYTENCSNKYSYTHKIVRLLKYRFIDRSSCIFSGSILLSFYLIKIFMYVYLRMYMLSCRSTSGNSVI